MVRLWWVNITFTSKQALFKLITKLYNKSNKIDKYISNPLLSQHCDKVYYRIRNYSRFPVHGVKQFGYRNILNCFPFQLL